jgi:acyl-CoA thioesterase-1
MSFIGWARRFALGLALVACSRETAPGSTARAAEAPPKPSASVALPADPSPAPTGEEILVTTDAGRVPAARAERVLHAGDSMVPLVGNYLRKVYWADGRKYWTEVVVSSSTLEWAGKRLLQDAMYRYDPDLILISLGSNELFDPDPERRAPAIRQIIEDTRGRPCLWIGPPSWKQDTGFIEVLKKNLGHCRYFDSTALKLPRMEDGRHPSWTGGWQWSSAVWKALGGTTPIPTDSPIKPEKTASP